MTEQNGLERSSATEELRRLLDERGVEYKDRNVFGKHVFHWGKPFHGAMFTDAGEWTELVVENASPEQAVEATLGRGACRDLAEKPEYRDKTEFKCSECGYEYSAIGGFGCDAGDAPDFRYCPNCGRKVVDA